MLETTHRPYEFLARWNEQGELQGSHAIFSEVKSFNSEVLTVQQGQALTPDQAAAMGFPFEDVLTALQADALARVAALETEAEEARKAHALEIQAKDATTQALQEMAATREAELQQAGAATVAQLEAAQQERDAALAQVQRLQAEVEGLTTDLRAARALAGTLIEEPAAEPEAPAEEPAPLMSTSRTWQVTQGGSTVLLASGTATTAEQAIAEAVAGGHIATAEGATATVYATDANGAISGTITGDNIAFVATGGAHQRIEGMTFGA